MSSQIDIQHPFNVCRASAGTGKTFTLAAYYVGLLLSGVSYRNILAVTFTNKATDEMKSRILSYLYAIAENDRSQQAFFEKDVVCKPFKKHHAEQLKLVSSFDWIDFEKLSDVKDMIIDILSSDGAENYLDENRIRVIAEMTERRIRNLEMLAMSTTPTRGMTTEDDVEEDIAEDYGPKMNL